ncbi:TPA: restriction endonuclease subunit S [Escherichia coli]|uniref:Restriction endonuclease subunit S n=4 Tax=Escherichia coli TaxID=562 RepID=A0A346GMF0_ECOLX|nr:MULTISPECIES: restriction endonuclease subunit S [Enterobacteriaceae]MBJ4574455.1 restriction endonuclease subunit S [Salmonella enterica subsp. enterica serovar Meleagridis]ATZ39148.1 restriction endonuclease subunit S [Escherichia coli]AUA47963.1 restriction endonuclease subunit S [Escherichia coli]AXO08446.1 restriction endonuclease subunit S [Escherichia coli]EKE1111054.1 restriction endonuclease subunit S [Escherichia coli]
MSEMSYLEKLLDGVEVEWLPLGEVSALRRGRVMSKGYLTENFGPYPVYSSQTANNGKIGSINTFDFDGEYISWTTDGANAGTVFYRTGKFSITNVCGLITLKSKYSLIYKFLFYWLTIEAKKHVYSGMGNPKLMSHQVENIPVPIPCPDNPEKSLAIQSEIVRILDKFTELTAELTAELSMRKKQYNYYRDQLLSFDEEQEKPIYLEKLLDGVEVEWKTLGKVLKRTKGTKITAGQMKALHKDNAPLKIFAGGKTVAFVDFKDIPEKDINREPSIIVKSRGIIEFEYYDKPFSHKNEMWSYHSNNDAISIKYIYYFLKINEGYFQKIGGKMQMPQIATPDTDKFEVPIPCPDNPEKSLAIQSEIVRILDKFDTLTNSITEGLPREIELRQKQYEYYRDLLFSFPKPETVSN